MLRSMLIVVFAAAGLWAGYWFFGSYSLRSEVIEWADERRSDGWQFEYSDISVKGFPNRFDTTVTNLQIADPRTGVSWRGPFLQAFQLSYKPQHIIFAWPENHEFSTPYQKISLQSLDAKASLVTENGANLSLQRAAFEAEELVANSSNGWDTKLGDTDLNIRRVEGINQYEIAASVASLAISKTIMEKINRIGSLPDNLNDLRFRAQIGLTAPLDIQTIEVERPQIETIAFDTVSAHWGESQIRLAGSVSFDTSGLISGELVLNTNNWKEALEAATQSGAISIELTSVVRTGLQLLATLSGTKESLEAPLRLESGRVFLGPIPIGKIPPLVVR